MGRQKLLKGFLVARGFRGVLDLGVYSLNQLAQQLTLQLREHLIVPQVYVHNLKRSDLDVFFVVL